MRIDSGYPSWKEQLKIIIFKQRQRQKIKSTYNTHFIRLRTGKQLEHTFGNLESTAVKYIYTTIYLGISKYVWKSQLSHMREMSTYNKT